MKNKRLIIENWYDFIKSPFSQEQEQEMYTAGDPTPVDTAHAMQEIARLKATIAELQKELAEWEEQVDHDVYSASQMKEGRDG